MSHGLSSCSNEQKEEDVNMMRWIFVMLMVAMLVAIPAVAQANDLGPIGTAILQVFKGATLEPGTWVSAGTTSIGVAAAVPFTGLANAAKDVPVLGIVTDSLRAYCIWPGIEFKEDGTTDMSSSLSWYVGPGVRGHIGNMDIGLAAGYDITKFGQDVNGESREGWHKVMPHGVWFSVSGTLN
jgi:hypothetical protein